MNKTVRKEDFGNIAVGLYDIPYSPQETVLYLNLLKSNAMIFGSAMSGKTTMVKNILARMNEEEPYVSWENTYILDFGGNISRYSELGRVCACFDNSNDENVKRIFKAVEERFADNSHKLSGQNYLDYQLENPDSPLPHITFIIENATAFLGDERYSQYFDVLTKLARDGISKGVSVILTANDITGGLSRMKVHFYSKYALNMQQDKYIEIFNTKVDVPMQVPGRGVTVVDSTPCEFQAYLPFEDEKIELSALIESSGNDGVKKMKSFPVELTDDNVGEYCVDIPKDGVFVGLEYYGHTPIVIDFEESRNLAIYGKRQFGKTNLLRLIIRGLIKKYPDAEYLLFDDRKGDLEEFSSDLENSGAYVVYENDYKEFMSVLEDILKDRIIDKELGICEVREGITGFVIIQNKKVFINMNADTDFPIGEMMRELSDYCFIFTDVPKIADHTVNKNFNVLLNSAFLFDNIGDFIGEKGSSSVFGFMDQKEMKRDYAACVIGDGYYYDIDKEELKKFKAIKTK